MASRGGHPISTGKSRRQCHQSNKALRCSHSRAYDDIALWPMTLDERGYYKASDLVEYRACLSLEGGASESGTDLKQRLRDQHKWLRANIRVFLAHLPVLEKLSELVGVKAPRGPGHLAGADQQSVEAYVPLAHHTCGH